MSKKAQVLIEFLIILMVLLGIFSIILFIAEQKNTGFLFFKEQTFSQQVADKLAQNINQVYLAGNATQSKVFLESDINYSVSFAKNSVLVFYKSLFASAPLNTSQISSQNILPGTELLITNSNGEITIEST